MENKIFQWTPDYSVNVKELDEQHKKFIAVLNDLYQAILNNRQKEELQGIFAKLDDYLNFHFATEEKYFDKFNYEGSEEHKAEHQKAKDKIADIKQRSKDDEKVISFELIDFLEDWLISHVDTMDKKYTKCFNEHGLF